MSWLPISKAWVVLVGVVSVFLWKLSGVIVFLFAAVSGVVWLIKESLYSEKHYAVGF